MFQIRLIVIGLQWATILSFVMWVTIIIIIMKKKITKVQAGFSVFLSSFRKPRSGSELALSHLGMLLHRDVVVIVKDS